MAGSFGIRPGQNIPNRSSKKRANAFLAHQKAEKSRYQSCRMSLKKFLKTPCRKNYQNFIKTHSGLEKENPTMAKAFRQQFDKWLFDKVKKEEDFK